MPEKPNPPLVLTSPKIAPAVRKRMQSEGDEPIAVIFEATADKTGAGAGIKENREAIEKFIKQLCEKANYDCRDRHTDFYVFATLRKADIEAVAKLDSVRRVWADEQCDAHLLESAKTLKAPACWRTFCAEGQGITWAILDTGINADHPHFKADTANRKNDIVNRELSRSFVDSEPDWSDANGHGTHVAGIISGMALPLKDPAAYHVARFADDPDSPVIEPLDGRPSGIAPQTELIAVKVLDKNASGSASSVIQALEYLRKLNEDSSEIRIDGANLSLGYPLEPESYGCGFSPICQEVDRVVRSGICVVISCGNDGYGVTNVEVAGNSRRVRMAIGMSISDPANAEGCIAVGSVHKGAPHKYGVSYFSSKGPTADGRNKPDVVAPGEKIVSCSYKFDQYQYIEMSGTSMAAPHVSGAIASFLSAHPEYRGNPEEIKKILLSTATDLGRNVMFQGRGLVDMLRATMSV